MRHIPDSSDIGHRRTAAALVVAAVALVTVAWATTGPVSLLVAILAAGTASALVAHQVLGPSERGEAQPVSCSRPRPSSSSVTCTTPSARRVVMGRPELRKTRSIR